MKIAFLGTRGIPASYSGFETCAEQLGSRLVKRGHRVTVYGRSHHIAYQGSTYRGVHLVKLPTLRNKYLDTIIHTLLSSLHALFQGYDIAIYFIAGNSPLTWIPKIVGTRTLLNVDGLDWKRDKWPWLAKRYLQLAERLATVLPDLFLTDSLAVQSYYTDRFNSTPPFIPYGSEVRTRPPGEVLTRFDLRPGRYVLFVGRLVPENCVHHLVEAFKQIETDYRCVIVGGASYADAYIQTLKARAASDPRIVFTGYLFGAGYEELGSNAGIFVETSRVGGTHPALVEAMAFGNTVVVNDTPENLETIGEAGFSYHGGRGPESLAETLQSLLDTPEYLVEYPTKARRRAAQEYSWESVTDRYEALCYKLAGISIPESLQSAYDDLGITS